MNSRTLAILCIVFSVIIIVAMAMLLLGSPAAPPPGSPALPFAVPASFIALGGDMSYTGDRSAPGVFSSDNIMTIEMTTAGDRYQALIFTYTGTITGSNPELNQTGTATYAVSDGEDGQLVFTGSDGANFTAQVVQDVEVDEYPVLLLNCLTPGREFVALQVEGTPAQQPAGSWLALGISIPVVRISGKLGAAVPRSLKVMAIISRILHLAGLAAMIWLAVLAFKHDGILAGLLCLCCCPYGLYYGITHLDKVRYAFIMYLTVLLLNLLLFALTFSEMMPLIRQMQQGTVH